VQPHKIKNYEKYYLFLLIMIIGDTGKTGYWTEEFAAPYYELADEGVQIDIATPRRTTSIDPKSDDPSGDRGIQNDMDK
jgi:putative intracellular protease/amidase